MRRLSEYLQIAVATVMAACTSGTAKVPREDVRVANPDCATIVALDIDTLAPVNEITANTAERASAAEPHRPKITLPVTPSDTASVSLRGATLSVPLGAVEKELTLSITALGSADLARLPQGMVNVTRGAAGFRFLPHGKHFTRRDARVSLPVDTLLIPRGYTHGDVLVYYYDEGREQWASLPRDTTSQEKLLACALTSHFTDMIAGVLQVPETPETQGFVPTDMAGIWAADPTSGIISVQAPQAAQSGAATLRYPIVTPAGRNGMQPDLALTYSSEGRSGWCGYGWSLRVPSIEIDTRWGVPRFDARYETEIYLVNGEQTTLQPHRSPERMERVTDREFHPRTETTFARIVRHGSSPKDYWWEVSAKDGISYEYKATVKNDEGNIVYWGLTKVTEPHGDNMTYSYKERNGRLYLSEIRYTNHDKAQGNYKVEVSFADKNIRRDVTTSYRLGLLRVDSEQLGEISVYFQGGLLARYKPEFEEGALRKTILTSIAQYDAEGKVVGKNTFDYYNEVADGLFGEAETWDVGDETQNLRAIFDPFDSFTSDLSALNGTYSKSISYGGGVMFGYGPPGDGSGATALHVGPSFSGSSSRGEGRMALCDMNGDGLPDKVLVSTGLSKNTLRYRPNLGDGKFGDLIEIRGVKGNQFFRSKSRSWSTGANVSLGKRSGASAAWDSNHSVDRTFVYMQDFNGDGLTDMAIDGQVYFNHIDADGVPHFSMDSGETPNPLAKDVANLDDCFIADPESERAEIEASDPLQDAVRVWRAPFDGTVEIKGTVELTRPWTDYPGSPDGVVATIQHLEKQRIEWTDSIIAFGGRISHNEKVAVLKGQRILFRLQSRYSGALDEVSWNPTIKYTGGVGANLPDRNEIGQDVKGYRPSDDFLFAGGSEAVVAGDCQIAVSIPIKKDKTHDDIVVKIIRTDRSDNSDTTIVGTIEADDNAENLLSIPLSQTANDTTSYRLVLSSPTPVDWRSVSCHPMLITAKRGKIDTTYVAPDIERLFANQLSVAASGSIKDSEWAKISDRHYGTGRPTTTTAGQGWARTNTDTVSIVYDRTIRVTPSLSANFSDDSGTADADLQVVLRDNDAQRVLARHEARTDGNLPFDVRRETLKDKSISAAFYIGAEAKSANDAQVKMTIGRTVTLSDTYKYTDSKTKKDTTVKVLRIRNEVEALAEIKASVSSIIESAGLGHLYRGWGQFGWDATSKRRIEVGDVDVDKDKYQSLYENRNTIGGDSTGVCAASASQSLYVMTLDPQNGRYKGKGDGIHVSASTMSSSRIGEPEIALDIVDHTSAAGLRAMVLETRSEGNSVSASGGFAATNAGGSRNTTKTTTENSAIDLNGDLYPDWVSNSGGGLTTQYTSQTGPLSGQTSHCDFSNPESESCSWSVTAGASKKTGGCAVTPQVVTHKGLVNSGNDANAKAGGSAGVSGSFAASNDASENIWLDINGDGLPDMVYGNGTVRLNQGYSFSAPIYYGHSAVQKSHSSSESGGVSFYLPVTGYFGTSGGASFSATQVQCRFMFADIDGDGLPDMVDEDGVAFNNGQGFDSREKSYGLLSKTCSTAMSAHGEVSVKFRVPLFMFGFLFITPNVSAWTAESSSRVRRQLLDIDGDGYADLLESERHDKIKVRRNKAGKTNLLRQVTSPLGATTVIDYDRTGNTYDLPQSRWVMSKVTTNGGDRRNGTTSFATAFEYAGGYYDRRERDFFGFGVVKSTQLDTEKSDAPYRTTTLTYDNRTYETRNLVKEATVTAAGGALVSRTKTAYTKQNVHDGKSLFVAPSITSTTTFEQGSDDGLTISESYAYDGRGSVTGYASSAPTDSYTTEIKYHSLNDRNIFTRPSDVKVSVDGKVLRHTTSEINANGDIVRISQIADGVTATSDMERDVYGNVTRLTRPGNANGQRFYREYAYDGTHHTLVTNVKDAFGYASSTEYDSKWGLPTRRVDINGNETIFAYDRRGRLTSVTAPYEAEAGGPPTISVEYDDDRHATITTNYDSKTRNAMKTSVFADGLGRIVQTKRSGVVDGVEAMIASGTVKYDALGRKVAVGQPMTDDTPSLNTGEALNPTLTEYDLHDRPVRVTLPDGTVSTAVRTVFEGLLKTVQTDGNGHETETCEDARGRIRKTVRHAGGQEIVTEFSYNAIGELLSVVHPNGEATTYGYDGLGRRTAVNHPDAGLTTYEYDAAGNMTARQTANIRSVDQNGKIRYTYDYERLHEIVYPKNIHNRVTYTYGEAGDSHNRAGRLALVEDGSGGEAYYYGKTGEVVKTIKSVILSETDIRTYVWEADYDSWSRVRTMTYPDGEVVSYAYDKGGNLTSVTTEKEGDRQTLLAEQRYDKYGNITYRRMGNGTETRYEYDEKRLYLNSMSLTSGGSALMENAYKYDGVGNVLRIANPAKPNGDIGGAYSHTYQYDETDRLVSASGTAKGRSYETLMRYDVMSNPLQKDGALYEYNTIGHPNAVSGVGGRIYSYDPDGNPVAVEDTVANTLRVMQWDEEDRLQALGDDGYVSRYTYDHAGGRVVKSHGPTTVAFVNGAPQGVLWHDKDNWAMYVSPYMTVTPGRFTKHYYAGTRRIASKIGVGEFRNLYDASKACVTAGQKDYAERVRLISQSRDDHYAALGVPPGPPTAKGAYGEAEYSGSYGDYAAAPLGDHDAPDNWPRKPYKRPHGGTPGPPVMYGKATAPDDEGAGYGYKNALRQQESDVFYYHADHLGSTSYVTDKDGYATQFVSYKPYGEALVDEHNTACGQPWRFNGKELDAETGLYFYGARYYDPSLALWYGVDALAGEYPGLGGYVYCAGNPVRLVDVDGRKIKISPTASSKQKSAYDDVVALAKGSALFSTLYSKLEESHIVYTILFGSTVESTNGVVQAQYCAKDNSITINKNLSSISEAALTEELFHALQNESNDGSNREFEAKVFVFASEYVKTKSAAGMREFYDYLEDNMYKDTEGRPLSIEVVNSKEFVQRYRLAQKSFAEYNERNAIGNIHYKKHSDSSPALLIKIVNEAYSERN